MDFSQKISEIEEKIKYAFRDKNFYGALSLCRRLTKISITKLWSSSGTLFWNSLFPSAFSTGTAARASLPTGAKLWCRTGRLRPFQKSWVWINILSRTREIQKTKKPFRPSTRRSSRQSISTAAFSRQKNLCLARSISACCPKQEITRVSCRKGLQSRIRRSDIVLST